ncbi:PTS lactose/cellobiose transporter subunit IIA [Erysipelothrix sp. D19-032]
MEGIELLSFQMISFNGSRRSCFIEAIANRKRRRFRSCVTIDGEGEEQFVEGHRVHAQLIQQEAQEGNTKNQLIVNPCGRSNDECVSIKNYCKSTY